MLNKMNNSVCAIIVIAIDMVRNSIALMWNVAVRWKGILVLLVLLLFIVDFLLARMTQ
jgi:hypothetical protein